MRGLRYSEQIIKLNPFKIGNYHKMITSCLIYMYTVTGDCLCRM